MIATENLTKLKRLGFKELGDGRHYYKYSQDSNMTFIIVYDRKKGKVVAKRAMSQKNTTQSKENKAKCKTDTTKKTEQ